MKRKCKLILALDVAGKKDFVRWIDATKDLVEFYKVGLIPFTALGNEAITLIKKRKKKVFLDLKFFDIPNTMIRASLNTLKYNIDMLDFHLLAEKNSLVYTLKELRRRVAENKLCMPIVLGITVLTNEPAKSKIHVSVVRLAKKAKEVGCNGVVCSGKEAQSVRKTLGPRFTIACPGIRLKASIDDQKRVVTPSEIKNYADFIIVGRPILEARNPRKIINRILDDLR